MPDSRHDKSGRTQYKCNKDDDQRRAYVFSRLQENSGSWKAKPEGGGVEAVDHIVSGVGWGLGSVVVFYVWYVLYAIYTQ